MEVKLSLWLLVISFGETLVRGEEDPGMEGKVRVCVYVCVVSLRLCGGSVTPMVVGDLCILQREKTDLCAHAQLRLFTHSLTHMHTYTKSHALFVLKLYGSTQITAVSVTRGNSRTKLE